jgi:YceI-like domain
VRICHGATLRSEGASAARLAGVIFSGTARVTLKLEVNGFGPDVQGSTRAGFSATGEINRMDFGVSYNGPIPGGGVAISEAIQIMLEIEAILQADS